MKRTSKRVIAFFLTLVLMLSLCACAQKQQTETEADEPNISTDGETLPCMPDKKLPEKLRPGAGESDGQPTQVAFSEEAEQSLVWLRDRMDFPQIMFGAAYLGYTGEASVGGWLSEADQAMLQKYPFIWERPANGKSPAIVPVPFHHMVCTITGDFRGAVEIDKNSVRQMIHPAL